MSTMNQPINDLIARVKELDAKATNGPIEVHSPQALNSNYRLFAPGRYIGSIGNIDESQDQKLANAEMFAFYRTACPQLADRCEKLDLALDVAKRALQEIYGCAAFAGAHAETCADTALSEINKLTQ